MGEVPREEYYLLPYSLAFEGSYLSRNWMETEVIFIEIS